MNFTQSISLWYSTYKRDLPWRNTRDPYLIWLSEIILQQTQIKQGQPYYEAFVAKFPSIFDLAKAKESEVLKLWQGLGYYSRARNLHFTAQYIANDLDGVFPDNYKDLLKLKGVGDYTASAIASFCFDEAKAVVDGNVYRVLSRYFGIHTPINSTEGIKQFKEQANLVLDYNNPANHNQAIMEFGALQCKPKSPDCEICPLNSSCKALKNDWVGSLPIKINKTKVKQKHFNFLVCIDTDQHTLFEKRKSKGIWQNLYQFPLLETEIPLDYSDFANHEDIQDLFKTDDLQFTLYNETPIIHKLSHQHLHTKFWIIEVDELPKAGIPITQINDFPTSILISNFIDEFDFQL